MSNYQGTSGNDSLTGSNSDDLLQGADGNDTLLGKGGSDTLDGGAGADLLDGGDGDDVFVANDDSGADTMLGGNGNDLFRLSYNYSNHFPGSTVVKIDAGAGNDIISFSFAQWAMVALPVVTGGSGSDTYIVGTSASYNPMTITDFATGTGGDRLDLTAVYREGASYSAYLGGNPFASGLLKLVQVGADTQVLGTSRYDGAALSTIFVLKNVVASSLTGANFAGNWNPNGAAVPGTVVNADDTYPTSFHGTSFDDTLNGNSGNHTLNGYGGNDVINGGSGNEALFGGNGNDTINGGAGNDTLYGNGGNNLVNGDDGDDQFYHTDDNGGNDTLIGGNGNDVFIYSNSYTAQATGGAGQDTYRPYQLSNSTRGAPANLTVTDFTVGNGGDVIDVMSLLNGYGYPYYKDGNPFSAANGFVRLVQAGADTQVQIDIDGQAGSAYSYSTVLTLKNVSSNALAPDNFVGGLKTDGSPMTGLIAVASSDSSQLSGTSFNDQLSGRDGANSYLYGQGGDDLLQAGSGAANGTGDSLYGGTGNDTLNGGGANDRLSGDNGNDILAGGGGNDYLDGGSGNDLVQGGAGDDTLAFGGGAAGERDTLLGGDGNDLFSFATLAAGSTAVATGGAGRDTYQALSTANDYGATFYGISVTDFAAGAGGDLIDLAEVLKSTAYNGGNPFSEELGFARLLQSGADTLVQISTGGAAAAKPTYMTVLTLQNVAKDQLSADNFVGGIKPDGSGVPGVIQQTDSSHHYLYGGSYDDTLSGTDGVNYLYGKGGADLLQAGSGDSAGHGDHLDGGAGRDTLIGGSASDVLTGGSGADVLQGGAGNDSLVGGAGGDVLQGGAGDDSLEGDSGNDLLQGGAGDDTLYLNVEDGTDNDSLEGGDGNDVFSYATASTGSAIATGGAGSDIYRPQADYYAVRSPQGRAYSLTVTDFTTGAGGDKIDLLTALPLMTDYLGGNPFASGNSYVRLQQNGADTLVQLSASGSGNNYISVLTLKNVQAGSLTEDNFVGGLKPDGSVIHGVQLQASDAGQNLSGGQFNDTLVGMSGVNSLSGEGGDDLLQAGSGDAAGHGDQLLGGTGNDTLIGGSAADNLDGGAGNNLVQGGAGNDTLNSNAGAGNDTLEGGAGDDSFLLQRGPGTLLASGGDGDDHFQVWLGGSGSAALLSGGAGHDTYVLERFPGDSAYIEIADFQPGDGGDVIDVTTLMSLSAAYANYQGGNPFDLGFLRAIQSGADTLLQYDMYGSGISMGTIAILRNVQVGSLTAQNMIGANPKGGKVPGVALAGTDGDDVLQGGYFDDTLSGGTGNDNLDGGVGNDLLQGGAGNDTLNANLGNDTADGGSGDDLFFASLDSGNHSLLGGDGDDTLYVAAASAGAASIRFNGGAGDDHVDIQTTDFHGAKLTASGGAGSDLYSFSYLPLNGNYRITDFATGAGGDKLDFDVLFHQLGLSEAQTLDPLAAGYLRLVQQGTSVLVQIDADAGGAGAPLTIVTLENVKVSAIGGANFVGKVADYGSIHYGGMGADDLSGQGWAERFESGAGDDTLAGNGGADTMLGGTGNDLYIINDATAIISERANEGSDTVQTDVADYTLAANLEVLQYTGSGTFHGVGNASGNVITAGNADDTLDGGGGGDILKGLDGNDTYIVRSADDRVIEAANQGSDLVEVAYTVAGSYTLADNVEAARIAAATTAAVSLSGNGLDNTVTGNAAANTLFGYGGNDTLDGGAGADQLSGGNGDDVYVVDHAGDSVTELAGEGVDMVQTSLARYTLTANVEQLLYTGSAGFTGTGNALNNDIVGGSGNDSLSGGAGNDTVHGMGGADTIDGGAGDDTLILLDQQDHYTLARSGGKTLLTNTVSGERLTLSGIETLAFTDGSKTLAELIVGQVSDGDDYLTGSPGDDSINGLSGNDTLVGGQGNDRYVLDNGNDHIKENSDEGIDTAELAFTAPGTYVLEANVEHAVVTAHASVAVNVTGNGAANALTGNGAANTLSGDAGNDTLDGGAGADKLLGGSGDDLYYVDNAGDSVTELASEGNDTVITTLARYTLGANVENLQYTGKPGFNGSGNELANAIAGGDGNDSLAGLGGNDTLTGGLGNDALDGGAGNDLLQGGAGNDSLLGGAGNDTLAAGTAASLPQAGLIADLLDGGADDDTVIVAGNFADYVRSRPNATDTVLVNAGTGEHLTLRNIEFVQFADGLQTMTAVQLNLRSVGNDVLSGSDLADTLDGGTGADTMTGGLGDDTYVVDVASDRVLESADGGIDLVKVAYTTAGTYTLADYVENATVVSANTLAVSLTGNTLDNVLTGNGAANTLLGGAGNDTLDGGAGADKMSGGSGDDVYKVDAAGDSVTELANEGSDRVDTSLARYTLGANVENLGYTAATGSFAGTGNALANVITGGNGNDTLAGLAGDDSLSGGAGNDNLQGGDGNDTLAAGAGSDIADGGSGSNTLVLLGNFADYTRSRPNATDLVLTNAITHESVTARNIAQFQFADGIKALADVLVNTVSSNADQLFGTDGNDSINGGAGADTMAGGLGNDSYTVDQAGDRVIEDANAGTDLVLVAYTRADTYVLGDNIENATVTATAGVAVNLTGNALDNVLTGNAAANLLTGGLGNDTLDGGTGADKLIGGLGDDVYRVDAAGDVVTELAAQGRDRVETTLARYTLGANVEDLGYAGKSAFAGTGNELANQLLGGDGGATLSGLGGDDTLTGGAGNDTLLGGDGADLLSAGSGSDVVDGGNGDDILVLAGKFADYSRSRPNATDVVLVNTVTHESLTVRGVELFQFADGSKALADVIVNTASSGDDHLVGTDGSDYINGGTGADTMDGGLGDDVYTVDQAGDVVNEASNAGTDTVIVAYTRAQTYELAANVENATVSAASTVAINLSGNALDNWLIGNAAANTLSGGLGNDILDGGAGADKLLGGSGDDSYVVDHLGDTITELADGGYDRVTVKGIASYTLATEVEELNFSGSTAFSGSGNAGANVLRGGGGADVLSGLGGNDTLDGNAGNDKLLGGDGNDQLTGGDGSDSLTGGSGADSFVLSSRVGVDTVTDFVSGTDKLVLNQAAYGVGNGDLVIDNAVLKAGPGGFGSNAELVILTQNVATLNASTAAAAIGAAGSAYAVGDKVLFAVHNANSTAVFLFTSSANDATVSAAELTQLVTLTGTPATTAADYLFA